MIAQARDHTKEEDEEDADQTSQASPRRALQRDDDRAQLERDGWLEMMLLLASSFPSLLLKSRLSLSCLFLHRCKLPLYCCEFWPVRRAIGRLTRMATASPTGTDNSVVTLLELPPRS